MNSDFIFFLAVLLVVFVILAVAARVLPPMILRHFGGAGSRSRLAQTYATTQQLPALVCRRQSVVVGKVLYRNCMIVGCDEAGLYLQFGFPLSVLGRPRLFIAWSEIKRIDEGRLFWRPAALLSFGEPLVGTITMPERLFETIRSAIGATAKNFPQPAAAQKEPVT